jgi:hypothetical protein
VRGDDPITAGSGAYDYDNDVFAAFQIRIPSGKQLGGGKMFAWPDLIWVC